MFSYWF